MKLMGTDNEPNDPKTGLPLMSEEEIAKSSILKTVLPLPIMNAIGFGISYAIYYFGSTS